MATAQLNFVYDEQTCHYLNGVIKSLSFFRQLSCLRSNASSSTQGFCRLINKLVIRGEYPAKLIELWHKFKRKEGN